MQLTFFPGDEGLKKNYVTLFGSTNYREKLLSEITSFVQNESGLVVKILALCRDDGIWQVDIKLGARAHG